MKKRLQLLTTVNSTFKYTCTVFMCHEEIYIYIYMHRSGTCIHKIYMYNFITHVCCVQYTALDSTSCGHTGTCT